MNNDCVLIKHRKRITNKIYANVRAALIICEVSIMCLALLPAAGEELLLRPAYLKSGKLKKISKPIKIRVPSMLEFSPSCNHAIWALHILEKICLENAAEMQVPEKMVLLCEVQREITKNIDGAFLSPVPRDAWIHEKLKTRSKNHKLLIHTLSCILYIGAVPIHVILNLTICNK